MIKSYVKAELKKWGRDSITKFILFYPIVLATIGAVLVPYLRESGNITPVVYDIVLVALALMTPLIFGFIVGFSILDDRDDNIIISMATTPLSLDAFIIIKLIMAYLSCFFAVFIILTVNVVVWDFQFALWRILLISLSASIASPLFVLLVNLIASNKVEGFAIVKALGIFIMFPIAALFFTDWKEFLFAFAPQFWAAKAISAFSRDVINQDPISAGLPEGALVPMPMLSGMIYLVIGTIVLSGLVGLCYRIFRNKIVY